MRRFRLVLFALVSATLAAFGVVSDRALEGQARQARGVAEAAGAETAHLTARSVAAALAQVEQAVLSPRAPEGVAVERAFVEPAVSVPEPSSTQYRVRRRADLVGLLESTEVTSSGLPEAVVAYLALGNQTALSGESDVARRLLEGELPVRREDLPLLAAQLGVAGDARVSRLQQRLAHAPAAADLPDAPAFQRRHRERTLEGWTHDRGQRVRYAIRLDALLALARVPPGTTAVRTSSATMPQAPVAEVEGLSVQVVPPAPAVARVRTLRLALWLAVGTSILGLAGAHRALAAAASANTRERAFLTAVTHELRTPLAAIRLFGETLAEGRGDPRDYGTLVAQESHRLESLVERVLAATRAGERPRFAETAPHEILHSAHELIAPKAHRRDVTLVWRADAPLPVALWDADAVRRALLNLLDNAVTHGRQGGRVEARAEAQGEFVALSVADDGPGIGPRERKGLFERFARGATSAPGTGLGLHLAEQVARAHGGRVELVTAEGRGCTFTLRLPIRPPNAPQTAPPA